MKYMTKKFLSVLAIFASILLINLFVVPVYADCPDANTPKGQVYSGIDVTGNKCDDSGVESFIGAVVKILSYIVGAAAIIMIVWSGYKYITSGGDSNKVTTAKNTLIYALVGVFIAVLAQVLVNTVLTVSKDAANSSKPSNQQNNNNSNNSNNNN